MRRHAGRASSIGSVRLDASPLRGVTGRHFGGLRFEVWTASGLVKDAVGCISLGVPTENIRGSMHAPADRIVLIDLGYLIGKTHSVMIVGDHLARVVRSGTRVVIGYENIDERKIARMLVLTVAERLSEPPRSTRRNRDEERRAKERLFKATIRIHEGPGLQPVPVEVWALTAAQVASKIRTQYGSRVKIVTGPTRTD